MSSFFTSQRSTASGPPPPITSTTSSGTSNPTLAFPTRLDSSTTRTNSEIIHRQPSVISLAPTGRFSINRSSALELHDLIYGNGGALNLTRGEEARAALDKLYEKDAVYSNPLVTASSGDVIKDIHSLMHRFTTFAVPTPLSFLPRFLGGKDEWLTVARVWSEVGEVLESDVFDGHRRVVIEHTVYFLFLPNVFAPEPLSQADHFALAGSSSNLSLPSPTNLYSNSYPLTGQSTPISGYPNPTSNPAVNTTSPYRPTISNTIRILTTLARQISLPVHTRLSFNDSGRITRHEDIWDVKDVVALVPGVSAMQWVGSRLAARSLSTGFGLYKWAIGKSGTSSSSSGVDSEKDESIALRREGEETPRGTAPAAGGRRFHLASDASVSPGFTASVRSPWASNNAAANALGLHLSERLGLLGTQGRSRAPDTDPGS